MPGNPLSLLYPVTGDSTTAVQVKWSTNFEIIQADLEAKVTEADIRVNGPLVMYDNPVTDVGSLLMSEQSVASAVEGTLTYANGFWYVADAVGAVRLTDGAGGFNSAGFKGIGKNYGAGDPAEMTYDAAGGEYSLTDDPGVYSDLKLEKVLLQRAAGSLSISADPAITGAQAVTIAAPPGTGTAALTITSAGVIAPSAAITVAQTFSDLTVTTLRRPSVSAQVHAHKFLADASGSSIAYKGILDSGFYALLGTAPCYAAAPMEVADGETVTSVIVYMNRTGAGSCYATLTRVNSTGSITYTLSSTTSVATGLVSLTVTPVTPTPCVGGEAYYINVYATNASLLDRVLSAVYTKQST